MYKLLLIFRYLRRKLAPLFAALAVTLCTAMVIIVISVMGGFLDLMRNSVRALSGDVMVRGDINGFPYYEELIEKLQKRPEVVAATPLVESYGLIKIAEGKVRAVEYNGIDPAGFDKVTRFRERMHWTTDDALTYFKNEKSYVDDTFPSTQPTRLDREIAELQTPSPNGDRLKDYGMNMQTPPIWGNFPGIVPGIHVNPNAHRDKDGQYDFANSIVGQKLTITVLRLSKQGQPVEPAVQQVVALNEFKSGLYDIDANRSYMSFNVLQKMLGMDAHEIADPNTGEPTGRTAPGRANEVVVRAKDGVPLDTIREIVETETRNVMINHADMNGYFIYVLTWEDLHRHYLEAVEKEKGMLVFLFGFISLVAVAMIGVIFYMIVLEKTRDIGVLRAIGASRFGIMGIFLGYGLAIGIVGSLMGLALAASVVWHLNDIQEFLNKKLGVFSFYVGVALIAMILGAALCSIIALILKTKRAKVAGFWGAVALLCISPVLSYFILATHKDLVFWLQTNIRFLMWDPSIYYFDRIPGELKPTEVTVIMIVAIISSVIGSLVPAYLAGRVDPVESLRYE